MPRKKKSKAKLRKELTGVFNKFIRLKDKGKPCISCGEYRVLYAGHFYPVGAFPEPTICFDERVVNGQCFECNNEKGGNEEGYKLGLISRHGSEIINELESLKLKARTIKWASWEYEQRIKHYKALITVQKMGMGELID